MRIVYYIFNDKNIVINSHFYNLKIMHLLAYNFNPDYSVVSTCIYR